MNYGMHAMNPMMGGMLGVGSAMDAAGDDPELYAQFQTDRNKQLIAQMLLARGQQQPQGQMVGRFYVPPSPLQHAGGLASMGLGLYGLNQADQGRTEAMKSLKDRRQQELATAISQMAKDFSPTKTVQAEAYGPGAPVATPVGQETADLINQDLVPVGSPLGQEFAKSASPLFEEGPRPTGMQEVPKSKEEIMVAKMKWLMESKPEWREAMKFQMQQEQQDEQKQLDRENRLAERQMMWSKDIMMAGIMGATKEQLAKMEEQRAKDLESIKQAGANVRDPVQTVPVQDKQSPTGWSYADPKTGKITMLGAPPPMSSVQQEKNENQGIKVKSLPGSVGNKFMENSQNLRMAERALALIGGKTAEGVTGDPNATGVKGYLPDSVLQRVDPQGVDTRAAIANLGSMIIHDRSGAAVTASEYPRLRPFIPKVTDDAETTAKKLTQFVTEYRKVQEEMTDFYTEAGYDVPKGNWHRGVESGGAAPPPSAGGLSPAEQQELNQLRQRFGK